MTKLPGQEQLSRALDAASQRMMPPRFQFLINAGWRVTRRMLLWMGGWGGLWYIYIYNICMYTYIYIYIYLFICLFMSYISCGHWFLFFFDCWILCSLIVCFSFPPTGAASTSISTAEEQRPCGTHGGTGVRFSQGPKGDVRRWLANFVLCIYIYIYIYTYNNIHIYI